ncbi:tetratricopeptide repeat protein [Rubrivirga litoralis]|uniref:Tetratricopeptide repeat protein n=1 Tax=Rubrivirga litoralis TaxID=3075598 RepID=A0ABU3BQP0_9BACT|nr:tetratricopeptide repeat protein [Rubrivirga sp. F394]MDT0631605.1 hypothetical protein [Rubrivirga sp. F394]
MPRLLAAVALLWALPAAAQLGETTFPNSGAPEAQEPFLRGVLLLHSFEYDDAREAFQEARRLDPAFAMAAWGEAMTHNHPVWQRQDRDAALAALGKDLVRDVGLGLDLSGVTPREEAYLMTLRSLFVQEGAKEDRDDAYALAMRDLAARFPDDLDAQAFYALALLGTAHEGRDVATYMEAAAVAEEVFAARPRHPGAAHYLIHAYDDPVHAPLGLRPARVYADVAPAASHALHMPSHITLALGMWEETAEMNRRSFEAAKANTDRKGQALGGHGWHALWWWHYAATQLGDAALARGLYDHAVALGGDDPDETALAHLARMRALEALEGGDPNLIVGDKSFEFDNVYDAFVAGLLATRYAEPGTARKAHEAIAAFADEPGARWTDRVAALQIEASLRRAEGDDEAAMALLREASEVEAAAPLTFGPPSPVVMGHEALGLTLLDLGRYDEAVAAFEGALDRAPNRRQAVDGLERARAALAGERGGAGQ